MNPWAATATMLVGSIPVTCLVYLIWAAVRVSDHDRKSPRYARRSVRFHGLWGMWFSLPLVVAGAVISSPAYFHWAGLLLLTATLACWAVAIHAMRGGRVPLRLRWLPLAVTCTVLLVLPAVSGGALGGYLFFFAAYSMLGLGLAAWLAVAINFAWWVRFAQTLDQPDASVAPELPVYSSNPAGAVRS